MNPFSRFFPPNRSLAAIATAVVAGTLAGCSSNDNAPSAAGTPPSTQQTVPAEDFEAQLNRALADGDSALAAYFAEYVLSAEELTRFVDKNFPQERTRDGAPDAINSPSECAREIRYTLARRLLREGRWEKAKAYFPEDLQPVFSAYIAAIQRGFDAKLPDAERARGFWDAALIVRADGDALFLAASGPVYVSEGTWERNGILAERLAKNSTSEEERRRVQSRDLDDRFVSDRRFRAAMLAQNAAGLLPNNDERTARILCTAGVWLRYRDPKTADSFYKSIVIRCPQTEIGKRCAELRWFPPALPWEDAEAWNGTPAPEEK